MVAVHVIFACSNSVTRSFTAWNRDASYVQHEARGRGDRCGNENMCHLFVPFYLDETRISHVALTNISRRTSHEDARHEFCFSFIWKRVIARVYLAIATPFLGAKHVVRIAQFNWRSMSYATFLALRAMISYVYTLWCRAVYVYRMFPCINGCKLFILKVVFISSLKMSDMNFNEMQIWATMHQFLMQNFPNYCYSTLENSHTCFVRKI